MKDLVRKVAVGLSTGALLANMMVAPALASTIEVVVQGNGAGSDNELDISKETTTVVEQENDAHVVNNISANASSGGNEADDNTGGDVSIDTGNAETAVEVSNLLNSNEASVNCGGCPTDVTAVVSGNGAHSDTDLDLDLSNETFVTQDNDAFVDNDIDANSTTGYNDADDNTGGDVEINTGRARTLVEVNNTANANVAHVGGSGEGSLELLVLGNGADSENDLDVDLSNTVVLDQDNWASIWNDVEADAKSGGNEVDDSTGGNVSIDTGDAFAGALVDTMVNFNMAHVEDCCEIDGLIKVAGNGADSDNDVDFEMESFLGNFQDNDYHQWNWLGVNAKSGWNEVDDSTGSVDGDPSIDTGSASTAVEVSNTGNSNVFSTGDGVMDEGWWEDFGATEGTSSLFMWWMGMMMSN